MQKILNLITAWMILISFYAVTAYTAEARHSQTETSNKSKGDGPLSREDAVREAVFKYQIDLPGPSLQQKDYVFFLSVDDGADPSDALLAHFAGSRPPVKKVSESILKEYVGIFDKQTGKRGVLFSVESIKWISETEAEVEGGHYTAPLEASGHVYKVKFENGKWVVKDDDMKWISRLVAA